MRSVCLLKILYENADPLKLQAFTNWTPSYINNSRVKGKMVG